MKSHSNRLNRPAITTIAIALFCAASGTTSLSSANDKQDYAATWKSLAGHDEAPTWFRDAKFGIYFHWGPYSVPAYGNEHYPRTMYGHPSGKAPSQVVEPRDTNLGIGFQTFREHSFHVRMYGEPRDFEYHQLIPLFSGNCFNAEEWADLFFLAGAKFAGPVAEHHDGYAMWRSELTPWNAADTGPHRDVVGEMEKAIRKRDMKFIATFHHARCGRAPDDAPDDEQRGWHYYGREKYWQRVDAEHSDSPELGRLYGSLPWEEFLRMWNGKLEEVVDNYSPDLIWFDYWLDRIPDRNRRRFAAYYLNHAQQRGQQVVITYKQEDLPSSLGVADYEKGRLDKITDHVWLTDDTISRGSWTTTGSWSYTEELDVKTSRELLYTLIDIVSKNGNLLLNISPTAEGLIPEDQRQSLLGVGQWLRANGEAIYGTRPFYVHGEGPERMVSSGHFVQMAGEYNVENIRYTTKGDTVYAIQLGWAGSSKPVLLESFAKDKRGDLRVRGVSVVDSPEPIDWELTTEGLRVTTPFEAPNKLAICFAIETDGGSVGQAP